MGNKPIAMAVHTIAYLCGRGTKMLPIQTAVAADSTAAIARRIGLIYGSNIAKKRCIPTRNNLAAT